MFVVYKQPVGTTEASAELVVNAQLFATEIAFKFHAEILRFGGA
jgi:acetylglutamate kinase